MTKLHAKRGPDAIRFRDSAAKALMNKSDQQIDQYIDTNVTDLASAKEFLAELTKITRDVVRYNANRRG